jgi:chaperone required for assembly of F1-ATPase
MTEKERPTGPDLSRVPLREPPPPKAKRFYKEVSVAADGRHYRVLLDNRPVKTPLRRVLETHSEALAAAIAAEWHAQATEIDPFAMPLTRLLSTALDRISAERAAMTAGLLAYLDTDLLCYRAPHPADLKARQAAVWQPILDWLTASHGIALTVVHGVVPITQPAEAAAAAARVLETLSVDEFTGLQAAVAASGSLALGIALVHGRISSAEVFAAAQLDETYQNEHWGEDSEALDRRARIAAEVEAVGRYLALVRA